MSCNVYEILFLGLLLVYLSYLQARAIKSKWPYGIFGLCFFLIYPPGMFALEFLKENSIYWSLTLNQWVLIALWGEALGMYYVRSDVREKIQPFIGNIYAAITRKRH